MVLILIEKEYPLNEVIYYNTGKEFIAIDKIKEQVKIILQSKNIKFTELHPRVSFDDNMLRWGWCGGPCRWGTSEKTQTIARYLRNVNDTVYQYIGIAADEKPRIERHMDRKEIIMPLVEWNMTEKQCLNYCYSKGYSWMEHSDLMGDIELYFILKRVSCWCCRNKNLSELEMYKKYLPEYYSKLKDMERLIGQPMKRPKFLEERFKDE